MKGFKTLKNMCDNSIIIYRVKTFFKQEIIALGLFSIAVILVFDFPHRFGISICLFLLSLRLKQIPFIDNFLQIYLRDRLTIDSHWRNDYDLKFLNNIIKLLFFIFLLSFVYIAFFIPVEDLMDGSSLGKSFYIGHLGLGSLFLMMFFSLVGDLHIIFRRNRVVESKAIQCGIACVKFLAVFIPSVEVASHSLAVGPNPIVNFYQTYSPTGRGFAYDSTCQMIHHDILKGSSVYDKTLLIDKTTKRYSSFMEGLFVEENRSILSKELSTFECHAVGISKGRFY